MGGTPESSTPVTDPYSPYVGSVEANENLVPEAQREPIQNDPGDEDPES